MPLTGLKGLGGLGGQGASESSGYGSRLRRPSDLQPFLPSNDEVERAVAQREADDKRSWVWDVFDIPSKVVGAYSLRGAIKGFAEDGLSGAVRGAAEGYGWLTDVLGITDHAFKATTTHDIRVAFGDDQSQSGLGNFALNLAGDIVSDPFTWILPFGKIGEAAKFGTSSASFAKAVELGQRAALVFKFPGFSPVPLTTNLGLKSFDLNIAAGLDAMAGFLRTNKVTGQLIRGFNASFPMIRGAEEAATASKARTAMFDAQDQVVSSAVSLLTETMSPAAQKAVLNDGKVGRVVSLLRELGITNFDDTHTIEHVLSQPTPVLAKMRFDKALKDDKHLADIWEAATTRLDEPAFHELYTQYDHAIPQNVLDVFGVSPREGVDVHTVAGLGKPTTGEGIQSVVQSSGGIGKMSAEETARLGIEQGVAAKRADVIAKARESGLNDFRSLLKDVQDGKMKAEYVQQALDFGHGLMKQLGDAEVAKGILNSTLEYYFPRTITPAALDLINTRFNSFVSSLGKDGLNISASFMKQRKFTDLTTIEVNALLREFGSKITNNIPLKDIEEFGHVDGIMNRIFDSKFAKRIQKMDPVAADFLSLNPMHADFARIHQSALVQGGHEFFGVALHPDSPLSKGSAQLKDVDGVNALAARAANEGRELWLRDNTTGKVSRPSLASVEEDLAGKSFGVRFDLQRRQIRQDTMKLLGERKLTYEQTRDTIAKTRDLHVGSDLGIAADDTAHTVMMKRTLRDQNRIEESLRVAKENLAMARTSGEAEAIARNVELVDEYTSRLSHAKLNEKAIRDAINAELADLAGSYKTITGTIRDSAGRGIALSDSLLKRGLDGPRVAEAIHANRIFQEEGLMPWHAMTEEQKAAMAARSPDATLHLMDPEDAKGLVAFWKDQNTPDMIRKSPIMAMMRKATQVWQAWTVTNPLFPNSRVRDMVTGFAMLHQAGGIPLFSGAASDAWKISRAWQRQLWGKGVAMTELADKAFDTVIPGRSWKLADVLQLAQTKGLIGSGMARDEVAQSLHGYVDLVGPVTMKDVAKTFWRATPEKNAMLKAGYQVAQFGDDWVRLSGLIDRLKAGMDVDAAVDFVRKWTYNPARSVTSFERNFVKPVIPFQQFIKWSLSRTAEQLVTRPGSVSWIDKMRTVALQSPPEGGDPIDPAQEEAVVPEFIKDGLGIPYQNTPKGPKYFLLGGYLPAAEVGKIAGALRGIFSNNPEYKNSLTQYFVSNMNPFMREIAEQVTNHDYFTNQDIEGVPGQSGEMFGVTMSLRARHVLRDVRLLSELDRLNVINLEEGRVAVDAVERGKKLGSREELPLAERAIGSAFGILPRVYNVDPVEALRTARGTNEMYQSNLKGKLRFALENADKPAALKNVDAVKAELLNAMAQRKIQDQFGEKYDVPAREQKKRRVSLQLLQQSSGR